MLILKSRGRGRFCAVQIPQVSFLLPGISAVQQDYPAQCRGHPDPPWVLHGITVNGQQEPPGAAQLAGINPKPSCSSHTEIAAAVGELGFPGGRNLLSLPRAVLLFPGWNLPLCKELIPISWGWGSQVSPGPVVILWVFGADGDFWPELPVYPTAVRNAGSHTEMQVLDVWGSLGLGSAADPSAG